MEPVVNKIQKYPAYMDSGVDWLGEIPKNWEIRKLKFIADFINRGITPIYVESSNCKVINQATFSRGFFDISNIKFSKEIKEDLITNKGKVKKGDILLASTGGGVLGKVAFFDLEDKSYQADSHVTIIRGCEPKFMSKYFFYILSISYDLINNVLAQGSTNQTELQRDWFINFQFPVPTFPEQTSIASFLDRKTTLIDKAIGIKEKQIELLKERRQIIIHKSVTRGLNPNVKMKESGVNWIGKIPEHWELIKNRSLFHERNESGNDNLPLLSISIHSAVSSEELDDDANLRGKIKIENKSCYKLVKVGDIAFNMMRAWQGAIGAVQVEGMVSPAYIVAKPKQSMNSDYFEYQFRTKNYIQQMDLYSKGITDFRKRLYWNEFKQLVSILPPYSEQEKISLFISSINLKIDKAISSKEKEIEKLIEYKAILINYAVTGKIKVC